MRTREELESMWSELPQLPREVGRVHHIVIRKARGVHDVLETVELSPELGVHGDRWSLGNRDPGRQVTLMNVHVAQLIRVSDDQPMHTPGDNFLVDLDLCEDRLPVGAQLRLGDALLEVSAEPHNGCKKFRERFGAGALAWVNHKNNRSLRLRGVNCRVIAAGRVSLDDEVCVVS